MKLVGHEQPRATIEAAWNSGKLHHAWLLTGPRGVGKRTFADAAARMILSGSPDFKSADGTEGAAKYDAGAHPDFRGLTRRMNDKTGRLYDEIPAADAREIGHMLGQHPSLSAWRVVTIDAACELNRTAANALLKNIEEPPEKTVFFLICHRPGRLLATIRSRARTLAFRPLSAPEVEDVLVRELETPEDLPALVDLAGGVPGRAIRFAGLEIAPLLSALKSIARADNTTARQLSLKLGQQFGRKEARPRYEAFLELVPELLADAAKAAPPERLDAALSLWEEASALAATAQPKTLDPSLVVFQLARLVGQSDFERARAA